MIRAATPADIPAIVGLERAAATAAHWAIAEYERVLDADQLARIVLVSEEGGDLTGFLVARALGSEWEIENIAVAITQQRRGIATALLNEFVETARRRGIGRIFLEVRESNQAAQALYERCTFRAAGRRRAYYNDPTEDAVIYQRRVGD